MSSNFGEISSADRHAFGMSSRKNFLLSLRLRTCSSIFKEDEKEEFKTNYFFEIMAENIENNNKNKS